MLSALLVGLPLDTVSPRTAHRQRIWTSTTSSVLRCAENASRSFRVYASAHCRPPFVSLCVWVSFHAPRLIFRSSGMGIIVAPDIWRRWRRCFRAQFSCTACKWNPRVCGCVATRMILEQSCTKQLQETVWQAASRQEQGHRVHRFWGFDPFACDLCNGNARPVQMAHISKRRGVGFECLRYDFHTSHHGTDLSHFWHRSISRI